MISRIISGLRDFAVRRCLRHLPLVRICPHSKVSYRKINFRKNCALEIGCGSIVEGSIFFDKDGASVKIGSRVFVGASNLVCAREIEIGDDVLISWGCTIVDHNSHSLTWPGRARDVENWFSGVKDWSAVKAAPVKIGSKSWLGFNVSVLKGVTIGEGAVVGACSVVTRDVPPYTVVAGNPAKVIREISQDE